MSGRFNEDIEPGDRIRFIPKKPKFWDEQEGVVVDEVNGGDGYNVLLPLPDDPGRILRLWRRDGDFVVIKKAVKEPVKEVTPPNISKKAWEDSDMRRWSVYKVASEMQRRGLSAHSAWDRYVIETGLQPQFDLKDLLAAYGEGPTKRGGKF